MNLVKTVKCRVEATPEYRRAFRETMRVFADACNYALGVAIQHNTANKIRLQKLCYREIRSRFGLTANLAIQALRRVAASYKAARAKRHKSRRFQPTSVSYDQRIFSMTEHPGHEPEFTASLSTVRGRIRLIPLRIGNYQRHLLRGSAPKAATLLWNGKRKSFYLHIVLEWDLPAPTKSGRMVGVDRGITNLATTSHGLRFSGKSLIDKRSFYQRLRQSLQTKGTPSSRRTLRRLSGKEQRWMKSLNHVISRRLVDSLQPGDTIVMEDLTHIRERTEVQRTQRWIQHSWAFRQLQTFIEYKALERGISVIYIDPRNSSKTCSRCNAIGSRQGLSFRCECGYRNHADYNAAYNLAARGHALVAGLSSRSPEATPVDAKAAHAELRRGRAQAPGFIHGAHD